MTKLKSFGAILTASETTSMIGEEVCNNIPGAAWDEKLKKCVSMGEEYSSGAGVRDNIIQWVFIILGTVAVITLLYGGIQFMISQGDPGKAQKARMTIIYSIIGIIVVISAWAIVGFVLGMFASS